jgi:hypothetical protein
MSPLVRRVAAATLLAAVLALAGCGDSEEQVAPTEATIPRGVASDLAERAEEIARLLDEGDSCGAASEAHDLKVAARRAIENGRIPEEFREPIEAGELRGPRAIRGPFYIRARLKQARRLNNA